MKKSELFQLAFVILGISIIVNDLLSIAEQINFVSKFPKDDAANIFVFWGFLILFIVFLLGILLIIKSKYFSKLILSEKEDSEYDVTIVKQDLLHVSIVVLDIYFMIKFLPSVFGTIYSIFKAFIFNLNYIKPEIQHQFGILLMYSFLILVLFYSKPFTVWLQKKVL